MFTIAKMRKVLLFFLFQNRTIIKYVLLQHRSVYFIKPRDESLSFEENLNILYF